MSHRPPGKSSLVSRPWLVIGSAPGPGQTVIVVFEEDTTREALLARSLADLVPGAVWKEMARLFAEEGQSCQNARTVVTTLRCTRGDLPVEISVRRVALGGVLYAVIVARDISERVRAEAEQQKTQAFLETAIAQPTGTSRPSCRNTNHRQ